VSQYIAEIVSHSQLAQNLWRLDIIAPQGPIFEAGQYLSWSINGQRHGPFSIASAPADLPIMTFYSRHAFTVPDRADYVITLHAAQGGMTAPDLKQHYIFCAGGTGVTPFLSLRKQLLLQNRDYMLLWSMSHQTDKMMLPVDDPYVIYHDYQNDKPYISLLHRYLPAHTDEVYHFYVAGPMPFVSLVIQELLKAQISVDKIFSDMIDPRRIVVNVSL
jgi:ferredoxin-NADP reductase